MIGIHASLAFSAGLLFVLISVVFGLLRPTRAVASG